MMSHPTQTPIFFDATRRRSVILSWLLVLMTGIVCIAFAGLLPTILSTPKLPDTLDAQTRMRRAPTEAILQRLRTWTEPLAHAARVTEQTRQRARLKYVLRRNKGVQDAKRRLATAMTAGIPLHAASAATPVAAVHAAFFVDYDKPSLDSLRQHAASVTHLLPVWMHLSSDGTHIVNDQELSGHGVTNDDQAIEIARLNHQAILPVVQNYGNDDFQAAWLHRLLSSAANRTTVSHQLLAYVLRGHYQGINIDFETDRADDRSGMTLFMQQVRNDFHAQGLLVSQDIQLDSDTYDVKRLAAVNDFLVPMLYDEHASGTQPGPVASQTWYDAELADFMSQAPGDKVVLGLANYGYDWAQGKTNADEVSFQEAAETAHESRDGSDGIIQTEPRSGNPFFTYYDDTNGQGDREIFHVVWLTDAATCWNELQAASKYHPLGDALWRLGTEDPSVWDYLGQSERQRQSFDLSALTNVSYGFFGTQFVGQGDILDVVRKPSAGVRQVKIVPASNTVAYEKFLSYPSQYVIRRRGQVDQETGANTQKVVALTFDDGPDPRWTPHILDILQKYHVPATFFVVGENAEANPNILLREWRADMEIGNHSFTHPEIDQIDPLRTKLELDATQRVIEAVTGHMTTLFRAPNRADSEPSTKADLTPVIEAHDLGYLFVGETIDPTDWTPGIQADAIVNYVVKNAGSGNCILLHDAGGASRAETIKALPQIITLLKARGYRFVPVSTLAGETRSAIFPVVSGPQQWMVAWDRVMFDVFYGVSKTLATLFIMTIVLGIGRIVVFGALAARQAANERKRTYQTDFRPAVSVVIAAYNEVKVINSTIANLLASDYENLEIIVVDDGSGDGTADVVRAQYGGLDNIRVLNKVNGGKASALNVGIRECQGDILVALDADTLFARDTISCLVRHFCDPAIGAVSGNVKVGNRRNMLTRWQAIEYITSQNFDRRAFDLLNCITVVPGAIGAWRRDAVILAGLYSSETLAEDTDLTFKVRRLGYRIVTDNAALAYTEAPESLKNLAKQRFRWAFGTLQCLWKHRAVLMNPRFGAFGLLALPCLWVYQIGFQAIAPIVDVSIVWSLVFGQIIMQGVNHETLVLLMEYWALFTGIEVLGAALAFRLDREDGRLLFWLPLQRFIYRQMMYYVILKSLYMAIRGSIVGWGKFERSGTAVAPASPAPRLGQVPEDANESSSATTYPVG